MYERLGAFYTCSPGVDPRVGLRTLEKVTLFLEVAYYAYL